MNDATELRRLQGPYSVVVADPPWRSVFGRTCSRATERHYETMTVEEIAALPVADVVADDALLILWATAPMLQQALVVIEAWSFTYRTHGVWVKPSPGTGKWLRGQHELFLLARRGTFPAPRILPSGVIFAPRGGRHSSKPETLQDQIEITYPGKRYLELFGRRQRKNWTVWGNDPALETP